MRSTVATTLLISCLTAASVEARVGASHRRRLEHRKLHWAEDEVAIPNQYVVVFEDLDSETEHQQIVSTWMADSKPGMEILYQFGSAFKGVTLTQVDLNFLSSILEDDRVAFVEEDHFGFFETGHQDNPPSWGLDRIDQSGLPLDNSFNYGPTGKGVEVYVLDSGIRLTHNEFRGRVRCGLNAFDNTKGFGCEDDRGHGSHVAGTVGGATFGVAKDVELIAVKMLDKDGRGTLSSVVGGVDFVTEQKKARMNQPMVANLSMSGSGPSRALDNAIEKADNAGVIFVVSAGNTRKNACQISPARVTEAIVVGSTTSSDERSRFSNWGTCLTIFAPGTDIPSANHMHDNAQQVKSGTSMAAPHVAGAAALYLELYPHWTRQDIVERLQIDAVHNVIQDPEAGSPNLLLSIQPLISL